MVFKPKAWALGIQRDMEGARSKPYPPGLGLVVFRLGQDRLRHSGRPWTLQFRVFLEEVGARPHELEEPPAHRCVYSVPEGGKHGPALP